MTYEGHVKNGAIVLDTPAELPDGAKVRVEVIKNGNPTTETEQGTDEEASLYQRMLSFVGSLEGLPSDFAINHDHYLHGQPKRQG